MKRALIAIPHFFARSADIADPSAKHDSFKPEARAARAEALRAVILRLHELFSPAHLAAHHYRHGCEEIGNPHALRLDIVVLTHSQNHLLEDLAISPRLYRVMKVEGAGPQWLGLGAHMLIKRHQERYDWFAYLEDDLLIEDAAFFSKLGRLYEVLDTRFGANALVQPNRYELLDQHESLGFAAPRRVYPDHMLNPTPLFVGDEQTIVTRFGEFRLQPAGSPHAGCFFLDRARARRFAASPLCGSFEHTWVTGMDTAASLCLWQNFQIYKPALDSPATLEVRHLRPMMAKVLRRTAAGDLTWVVNKQPAPARVRELEPVK